MLLRHDLAASGEVNRSLPAFRQMLPFWLILHRAVHDMLSTVKSLQIDLDAAQVLILQDDLLHPERTKVRVARQLEEDLRDNPLLTGSGR